MYKLIAFDAYGTLFDVHSVGALAEAIFPGHGQALSAFWRDRQIEYTRLVTMGDHSPAGSRHYLPFEDITVRALRYTCKRLSLALRNDDEARLMAQYARLDPFPDGRAVLEARSARKTREVFRRARSALSANGPRSSLSRRTSFGLLSTSFGTPREQHK